MVSFFHPTWDDDPNWLVWTNATNMFGVWEGLNHQSDKFWHNWTVFETQISKIGFACLHPSDTFIGCSIYNSRPTSSGLGCNTRRFCLQMGNQYAMRNGLAIVAQKLKSLYRTPHDMRTTGETQTFNPSPEVENGSTNRLVSGSTYTSWGAVMYALGDFIHMLQVSLPSISIWSLQLRHFWRQLVLVLWPYLKTSHKQITVYIIVYI